MLGAVCGFLAVAATAARAVEPWRQRSFLIGGWCVGRTALVPDDFIAYDEAGLDYVANLDQGISLDHGRRLVALLDQLPKQRRGFDLRAIVYYKTVKDLDDEYTGRELTTRRRAAVDGLWAPGRGLNSASTLGFGLWDEPCSLDDMRHLAALVRLVRSTPQTARLIPLTNLFPIAPSGGGQCYEGPFGAGGQRVAAYAAYLDGYLEQFDHDPDPAPMLCLDDYPFERDTQRDEFFECLRVARDRAQAHSRPGKRIPLWVVIQLSHFGLAGKPFFQSPNAAQVRWQAWSAVAYGAKAIGYWTTAPVGLEFVGPGWGAGLLDFHGNRTDRFAPVRRLNAELHALGPTLMQLESVAVFHVAERVQRGIEDDFLAATPYRVIAGVDGQGREDCMVGYFKRVGPGDDWLLVVNKSLDQARSFRVRLAIAADSVQRVDKVTGRLRPIATGATTFEVGSLAPGSAQLFRIVDSVHEYLPQVTEVRQDGAVVYLRMPRGILRIDPATQARSWVSRPAGGVSSRLVPTRRGVTRRGAGSTIDAGRAAR